MLSLKQGFPEEGELVLCTITKIHYHSVFANLDEYKKSGMIHISEISPGRIRNINDFVREGKIVICKVLKIDNERGHIDLSLRRVSDAQRRLKANQIKQEQKAEKIIEFVAKKININFKDFFDEVSEKIQAEYESIYQGFEDVLNKDGLLEKLGIQKNVSKELKDVILQRIKPPEVKIEGDLNFESFEPDGADIIKDALIKLSEFSKENISVFYAGGGTFRISVKSDDYKSAEKILEDAIAIPTKFMESHNSTVIFERKKAK